MGQTEFLRYDGHKTEEDSVAFGLVKGSEWFCLEPVALIGHDGF